MPNRLTLALLLAASLATPPTAASAQRPTRDWHPSDRTIIGDFSTVIALAASTDRVFVVARSGVAVRRPHFDRWEGPYAPPPGVELGRVFAALADPLDGSLWLARPEGWIHFQPDALIWESGLTAPVRGIAFDQDAPAAGLSVATASGWVSVPRGSSIAVPGQAPARPLRPTTVADALHGNPSLQANAAQILLDPHLRSVRYTAAARATDRPGWYLGTSGLGLLFLSEGAIAPERIAFGLAGTRVGALFAAPGGVWAATERDAASEPALTYVGAALDAFRHLRPPTSFGFPFSQVRRLTGQGSTLWAATDQGAARIEPETGRVGMVDDGRGLEDRRVYDVLARRGRVTLATARGLAVVDDSLGTVPLARDFRDPAYALEARGDSTWVGTPLGLFVVSPRDSHLVQPAALGASPSFRGPVVDIAFTGDTLVALTRDQLLYRAPGRGWALGPPVSGLLGRLHRLIADDRGLWIAGDRGVGYLQPGSGLLRQLLVGDLPGAPTDLAVEGDYLWVGTDGGLARFRLDAVRP